MRLKKYHSHEPRHPALRKPDLMGQFFEPLIDEFFGWTPAIDLVEDEDSLTVKAELPGYNREDLEVSLVSNNLVLSGERKQEQEMKDKDYYRSERYYGKFHRSIPLPSVVNAEKIEAKYHDGVLTVTMSKVEAAKGKHVEISAE